MEEQLKADFDEKKKIEERFDESALKIGKEYFGEFLSELSRKRQGNLMVASVFAILLSYTFIKPTGGNIGGISMQIMRVEALPFLAGAITFYYLILYAICVFQDWQFYYLRIGTTIDFQRRLENEIHEQKIVYREKVHTMLRKHRAEHPDLPEEAFTNVLNLPAEIQLELKLMDDIGGSIEFLEKTEERFNQLSKLKFIVEVVFPIGLSLFAIGSVLWAGFLG